MKKEKCYGCYHFGRDSCRPESIIDNTCNYVPKSLDKCCLVLEGEDARRFWEYLKEPPTEQDIEIAKRVKKIMEQTEREELIRLIGKMNCKNCFCDCGSSDITTCTRWSKK